eukprot:TRINITY_DN10850_c0_g1_i1.p1 TRINITY_DN10850_c0_g1~~TRINITY_DN10850_c0_g1_i1.p1  ORF type:complete len:413 (+),score=83.88 TRINITY_DN10850_c0_g1_i1:86-1324(+)
MSKKVEVFQSQMITFRLDQSVTEDVDADSFIANLPSLDPIHTPQISMTAAQHMPLSQHHHSPHIHAAPLHPLHTPSHQPQHLLPQQQHGLSTEHITDTEILSAFHIKENTWTPFETKRLIRLSLDHYVPWTKRKSTSKHSSVQSSKAECRCIRFYHVNQVWEHISQLLKREAIHKTTRQCQVKWQNIKERAKKKKYDDVYIYSTNEQSEDETAVPMEQLEEAHHAVLLNHDGVLRSTVDPTEHIDTQSDATHMDKHLDDTQEPKDKHQASSSGDDLSIMIPNLHTSTVSITSQPQVDVSSLNHNRPSTSSIMRRKENFKKRRAEYSDSTYEIDMEDRKARQRRDSTIMNQLERLSSMVQNLTDVVQKQSHQIEQLYATLSRVGTRVDPKDYRPPSMHGSRYQNHHHHHHEGH